MLLRWTCLIDRLRREERVNENKSRDDRKCPENRQNGSDGGKGRGG